MFNSKIPPYGSTIIFELHYNNETKANWNEASSIKMFYLNETATDNLHPLNIPACVDANNCTIKQFASKISDLIITPKQWFKECELNAKKKDPILLWTEFVLILDCGVLLISIIIITYAVRKAFKKLKELTEEEDIDQYFK